MVKILVADDERWIRKGIVRMIDCEKNAVNHIFEAENLNQAMEIFRAQEPEIVLSDVCFPAENGCDLCEEIHALRPDTKIVMISAYDEFNYAKRAIKFQAVDYLLKPVSKELLNQVISQCVEKIKEEKQLSIETNSVSVLLNKQDLESQDVQEITSIQMIKKIMEQIKKEYAKQYKLSEMAEQCHVSEAYFSALFKRIAGKSPVNYIIHTKIDKARELMISTDYKMVTIAKMVGYEDYQYFAKMFKKVTGETPGEFRAGIKKEMDDEEAASKI